ncbi:YcnI family protein [Actinoplanes sp. TRM 88003]|uniref:YcnI family protein n=1 Tax=Paractinoplanes aksuensis TaxID=2939490 RepID=A0ABT1DHJ9_9ACTN|nr:YcnI family protein [Actinoplanes aksuensis]MCO8269276.1 YcnI family protein [Actinoplanes aksuensis]
MSARRPLAAILVGLVLAVVVFPAGPAAAHVSVSPAQATQGGFAVLNFRVPNERKDAATTKIQLFFPTDTPIIGATVRQLTGWNSQVTRGPLDKPVTVDGTSVTQAVTSITWTVKNPADAVTGSNYQEFGVSLGPLPKVDRVIFKTIQTYDNGELVRWIEEPLDGQPEPEFPAVVLRLTAGGGEQLDEHGMPVDGGAATGAPTGSSAQIAREAAPSNVAPVVAIAALVIAIAGLLLGLVRRRPGR